MTPTSIKILFLTTLATCMLVVFAGYSGIAAQSIDSDCINHGDVNLDGDITAADAQQAFYIVLGLYSPTYEEECAADCNGEGDVTAADAQAIFLVVLGLGDCVDPLVTPTPTNTPFSNPGALYSTDPIVGNMRCVPHGSFTQGSPEDEPCRDSMFSDETQFEHTLTKNIVVMETEISRQMWADLQAVQPTLLDDPSSTYISPLMINPVQYVFWYEIVLFSNILSLQNGYTQCYYKDATYTIPVDESNYTTGQFFWNPETDGYRLPSEGEWEYFCRAGTMGPFSCFDPEYNEDNCNSCITGTHQILEQYFVYCANDPGTTHAVGSKLANPWNIKDVHGNVREWCWDQASDYPDDPVIDYKGPANSAGSRIIRGGSWDNSAKNCRSAKRTSCLPGNIRSNEVGFRLVRTAP